MQVPEIAERVMMIAGLFVITTWLCYQIRRGIESLGRLAEATERTARVLETSHAAELRGLKPLFAEAKAEDVRAWRRTFDDAYVDELEKVRRGEASPNDARKAVGFDPVGGVPFTDGHDDDPRPLADPAQYEWRRDSFGGWMRRANPGEHWTTSGPMGQRIIRDVITGKVWCLLEDGTWKVKAVA